MQITIPQNVVDALKGLHDVPDNLAARIGGIAKTADGYTIKLSDDEATAMAELAQWHMRIDPATGKLTAQSVPFGELIRLIDEAQFA